MRRRDMTGIMILALALGACDKIPFLGKKAETPPAEVAQSPDSALAAAAAEAQAQAAPPEPAPAPAPAARPAAIDEPWNPVDTGTVNPGMTREEVIAIWGVPVAERSRDAFSYLYFRNGCEASCGTFDVVFLENNQVIDAVVRGAGHSYAGNSSSPPGRKPEATTSQPLTMPADSPAAPAEPTAPAPAPGAAE